MIETLPFDRADLVARRAYGLSVTDDIDEAMRTLIWANRDLVGGNPVIPTGSTVLTPPIDDRPVCGPVPASSHDSPARRRRPHKPYVLAVQ